MINDKPRAVIPKAKVDTDIVPNLPIELTSLEQWIMWKGKSVKGKMTKVPYKSTSHFKASTTKPSDWCTYDKLPLDDKFYNGIGLVITKGLIFIDFDHILDKETKEFLPTAKWAKDLITKLKPKYLEISPSGDGLHSFFKGVLPDNHRKKIKMGNGTELEVYTNERFSTITARPFNNSPLELIELQDIEPLMSVIGTVNDNNNVDTEAKSEVNLSQDEIKKILDDVDLIDSDDMSSIDLAFFKDYIKSRRVFDPEFIPTLSQMQKALKYKGLYKLRKELSSNNPDKYTKHKSYVSSTIKKAVQEIGNDFEVLMDDKKEQSKNKDFDEIFFDLASGKYVFIKGTATFKHNRQTAALIIDPKILNQVPQLIAEYNPTKKQNFVNQNGLKAFNTFRSSKYVDKAAKGIKEIPTNINFLLKHLISDDETRKVFVNALANHIQNGTSIRTAWIFSGIEGAGKGSLMELIFKVFGVHNSQKSKLTNFTGDKVKGIVDKLIGFVDESADSKTMYEVVENLKAIIGNKSYSSRALAVNEVDVLNFTMYFFAVNSFGFKLSENDRRMNIIECNTKLKDVISDLDSFHINLNSELQDFTSYLMSYTVDKKLVSKIVNTRFRKEMITNNLPLANRIVMCITQNTIEPMISEVDEDSEAYTTVTESLDYIQSFDRVQGSVLTNIAEDIFKLTEINPQYFKRNYITQLLKSTWEYKKVKTNGVTVWAYQIKSEGTSCLTLQTFNSKSFEDLEL